MTGHHAVPPTYRLAFPDLEREITCSGDETVFHAARRHGIRLVGACAGRGVCGSCSVRLSHGEAVLKNGSMLKGGRKWVRSCCLFPRSDATIVIAERSLAPVVRANVETEALAGDLTPDPALRWFDLKLPEATLDDARSDVERIRQSLPVPLDRVDIEAAQTLPTVLRSNDWSARVLLRGSTLLAAVPPGKPVMGLAIDLGTTNIVGYLMDLATGNILASLGMENPQTAWGADLVSRINHAVASDENLQELHDAVIEGVNSLGHDLCHAIGAEPTNIGDVAICGNTAMQHILLKLPVRQLGRAPFVAVLQDSLDIPAREIGLRFMPGACVHVAPNVGGFVGSDHVATLLATRKTWDRNQSTLVMDIGTNTEISLIHKGGILSASCPSGPALEGGHVACGMRAAQGAIERVGILNGRLVCKTIGNAKPVGICGSGILDALSAEHGLGIIDKSGRIREGHQGVERIGGKCVIALARGVYINQADIRAVQLAKAAIRTGVELLLEMAGAMESDIQSFILAGAFGHYIDIGSAIDIGLVPNLPHDRFSQVGNAAGAGISRILASVKERKEAIAIAERCRYVELSSQPKFQKSFMNNIGFQAVTGGSIS